MRNNAEFEYMNMCLLSFIHLPWPLGSSKKKERVFIVLHYTWTRNTTAVKNAFRTRFPHGDRPHSTTILRNLVKYFNEGTSLNLHEQIRLYALGVLMLTVNTQIFKYFHLFYTPYIFY